MRIKLVAKKNKFINRPGESKLKILTRGKTYNVEEMNTYSSHRYRVEAESTWTFWFTKEELKELFISLQTSRSKRIEQLGI
jgi:hypothetical protein